MWSRRIRRSSMAMASAVLAVALTLAACGAPPLEALAQRTCDQLKSVNPTEMVPAFSAAAAEAATLGADTQEFLVELNRACPETFAALVTPEQVEISRSRGAIAPNTFMTFEGRIYRLNALLQANLEREDGFEAIGVADQVDIDHEGELVVHRRAGDEEAVYTLSPAQSGSEGDEDEGVPALWMRWIPV